MAKYDWVPVGYTAKLDCVGGEVAKVSFEELRDPGWAYYVPDASVVDSQYSWDFTKPRVRVKAGSQRCPWPVWAK